MKDEEIIFISRTMTFCKLTTFLIFYNKQWNLWCCSYIWNSVIEHVGHIVWRFQVWYKCDLAIWFHKNNIQSRKEAATTWPSKDENLHYYLTLVKVKLKSHSLVANSASFAWELGLATLQSTKYSPLTPLTCGWSATKQVVAAPCTAMFNIKHKLMNVTHTDDSVYVTILRYV